MSKYHDDSTAASDPGGVRLSVAMLSKLDPPPTGVLGIFSKLRSMMNGFEGMLDEHLQLGDSRAACVMSVNPLLVAAYTDELDCVAMLEFPSWLVQQFGLKVGTRLLTVNTYSQGMFTAGDLTPGPNQFHRYCNFYPVIADFVSEDLDRIAYRKGEIPADEWQHCINLGSDYLRQRPGFARNGSPRQSNTPARKRG